MLVNFMPNTPTSEQTPQSSVTILAPPKGGKKIKKQEAEKPSKGSTFTDLKEQVRIIVIGLFISFIVLLITVIFGAGAVFQNYLASKQATYQNLAEQVIRQNEDIKLLIQLQQNSNLAVSKKTPSIPTAQ